MFEQSRTLAEIEFVVEKSESTSSGRAYAKIGGNTLLNYQHFVHVFHMSAHFTNDNNAYIDFHTVSSFILAMLKPRYHCI